ncbi:DUF2730 family protein [Lentibacillus sp. CBA3610]|uniref:DUF2730 family protein n=1 Tax=Lentibacillus sp. CBA3610 TaxID=2518176 RepID=UPI00159583DC|nr:DUF2730 family protein [Lentibacillus sp. CBA3610]
MSDITMEDLFVAIKELSNDVAKGNERLGNLETKVENIETRVESIETEMKKMRGDMRRMNYKFNDYINDLADSKARLTMLEKEIGMEW